MSLPAPNLDDRTFQDLVDDAKRLVQQRCPEWTDHNVSDPGVVLIEAVATMVDQMLYRMNRMPERHYVKFLDLIGMHLQPATAGRTDVTFHLSAPQDGDVVIPEGTEVATVRTEADDPIVFATTATHTLVASRLARVVRRSATGAMTDVTDSLRQEDPGFEAFQERPAVGDELLIGLPSAVPGCLIRIGVDCEAQGVGVDPTDPPLVWESWDGDGWVPCLLERDSTGGFNTSGVVELHVPHGHATSVIQQQRAGWIRCRIRTLAEGQRGYADTPRVLTMGVVTIGGTTEAVHAETITDEVVGPASGMPAQRFTLENSPLIPGDRARTLQISHPDHGWATWTEVSDFSLSGPDDPHFVLDARTGEGRFGPAIRQADGTFRQHGAVPPVGGTIRMGDYRVGGGPRGNVPAGALRILRSSVPFVERVTNTAAAVGGVRAESLEQAKDRAPVFMRTRGRCVTPEDYEQVAREAAPEAARVRCLPSGEDDPGAVRLLVVPPVGDDPLDRRFEDLVPSDDLLRRISDHIEPRRVIGARVRVQPAVYQGVTIVARLTATPMVEANAVRDRAMERLARHLDPVSGGADGNGWAFGRTLQMGEVYGLLQAVPGVDLVDDVRIFPADPLTGERSEETRRLELSPAALLFSFEHQVRVQGGVSA